MDPNLVVADSFERQDDFLRGRKHVQIAVSGIGLEQKTVPRIFRCREQLVDRYVQLRNVILGHRCLPLRGFAVNE
jgi:hypothetical protein